MAILIIGKVSVDRNHRKSYVTMGVSSLDRRNNVALGPFYSGMLPWVEKTSTMRSGPFMFPGVSVFKVVVGTSQCPLKQGWLLFETPLLFKFGFSGFWIRKNKIKRNEQLNHQQHTNLYKPQCHQRVLPLLQLIKPILLFLFILCPSILWGGFRPQSVVVFLVSNISLPF